MPISATLHVVMLLAVAGLGWGVVVWGRRAANPDAAGRRLGLAVLALWVLYNLYYFQPAVFAWERSLPLQVCDIIALVAAAALIRPVPIGRAILYFSAIPLASQAMLTPTGDQDPAHARFWLYWGLHAGIIGCSLFDVAVQRYRPTVREFLRVVVVDLAYVAVMLPIDLALGWNYGYLAPGSPDGRTLLDLLGPWPLRVLFIVGLVVGLQFAMLVVWHVLPRATPPGRS